LKTHALNIQVIAKGLPLVTAPLKDNKVELVGAEGKILPGLKKITS